MPPCRYHPLEPTDRVCAQCLNTKLALLTRREGGIRRLVDPYYTSAYADEDDFPVDLLQRPGCAHEKKPVAISSLLRTESHRESSGSNAFYSCVSEISTRLSGSDAENKSGAEATPSYKPDGYRCKAEQLASCSDTDHENETSKPPVSSLPSLGPSMYFQAAAEMETTPKRVGDFSKRVCISDLITQSMRETDGKYRKPCTFSQNLPHRVDLKDPSHGICLKTPIWKFKLFSKSSPIWRLDLKGSKVSPSKREVEREGDTSMRGTQKEMTGRSIHSRKLKSSPPDSPVRLWCPSPIVTFREGSFRWGKASVDKGSTSCRRMGKIQSDIVIPLENEDSTTGVFRRLFDLTQRRGTGASRSDTESTSSLSTMTRGQETAPPRGQFDEEHTQQAQLAANILSWMDGAVIKGVQPRKTCSVTGSSGEIHRFPETEYGVQ